MEGWLEVELAATDAWAEAGKVPAEAASACRERASFSVEAVKERERTTNHDVAAFVDVVAASVGDEGRWVHYGLTSSDVLDTALGLQLVEAGAILVEGVSVADRAGELADRRLLEGRAQPLDVAVRLERKAGQSQAEGGRLGVDAVSAADAERVAVLERPRDQLSLIHI